MTKSLIFRADVACISYLYTKIAQMIDLVYELLFSLESVALRSMTLLHAVTGNTNFFNRTDTRLGILTEGLDNYISNGVLNIDSADILICAATHLVTTVALFGRPRGRRTE